MKKHKVFVSYHHKNDQKYSEKFELLFNNLHEIFVSKSVQIGDIGINLSTERVRQIIRDDYLSDSTVTVVLIGEETWKRKHVDWEISSSIRNTTNNPRSGLIGIFLPTHPDFKKDEYDSSIIPPRLEDNVECGYATLHDWNKDPEIVQKWI